MMSKRTRADGSIVLSGHEGQAPGVPSHTEAEKQDGRGGTQGLPQKGSLTWTTRTDRACVRACVHYAE